MPMQNNYVNTTPGWTHFIFTSLSQEYRFGNHLQINSMSGLTHHLILVVHILVFNK